MLVIFQIFETRTTGIIRHTDNMATAKTPRKAKKTPVLKIKPPPEPKKVGPPDLASLVLPTGNSKPTFAQLVDIYEISRATLYRYQSDGVDLWNPPEVLAHIESQVVKPPAYRMTGGIRTFEEARLKKTLLEAERIQRQMDREDENVIPRGLVRDDALSAASQLKAGIMALASELPPVLVGMDEGQMQKRLVPILEKLLVDFTDPLKEKYLGRDV